MNEQGLPFDRPSGATILLVEDEDPVRAVLLRMLESDGYRVLLARNPDEALAAATDHAGHIALLVTDMVLPGMNGKDLVDRIKDLRPLIQVLCISGYPGEAMLMEPLRKQGAAFLHKPFPTKLFLDTVRALLASSPS